MVCSAFFVIIFFRKRWEYPKEICGNFMVYRRLLRAMMNTITAVMTTSTRTSFGPSRTASIYFSQRYKVSKLLRSLSCGSPPVGFFQQALSYSNRFRANFNKFILLNIFEISFEAHLSRRSDFSRFVLARRPHIR